MYSRVSQMKRLLCTVIYNPKEMIFWKSRDEIHCELWSCLHAGLYKINAHRRAFIYFLLSINKARMLYYIFKLIDVSINKYICFSNPLKQFHYLLKLFYFVLETIIQKNKFNFKIMTLILRITKYYIFDKIFLKKKTNNYM